MVFVYSLPPFWQQKQKSRELEAMGRNQNADFFAAASPADMQWSDFYRHIPDRDLAKEATAEERRRLNFQLLQENPLGAATCLIADGACFSDTC